MATPGELGLAFGLVLAAGAATAVGAATVCFTNQANHKMLAASLGVSAGVMLYVSFMEIFAAKSVQGFEDAGYTAAEATRYATLSFFAGMVLLWLLDKLVHGILHLISGKGGAHAAHGHVPTTICCDKSKAPMLVTLQQVTQQGAKHAKAGGTSSSAPDGSASGSPKAERSDVAGGATANPVAGVDLGEIRAPSITTGNITLATLVHRHPHHQHHHASSSSPTLVILPNGTLATTASSSSNPAACYPHHVLPDHELTGAEAAAHVVLRMHESATRLSHGPEEGVGRASHVASTTVAVLTEEVASAQERAAAEAGLEGGGVAAAAAGVPGRRALAGAVCGGAFAAVRIAQLPRAFPEPRFAMRYHVCPARAAVAVVARQALRAPVGGPGGLVRVAAVAGAVHLAAFQRSQRCAPLLAALRRW